MAHSQKSIRDHARNRSHPNVDNKAIAQQLEDLVKPCVYNQLAYYRSLGMRARILSLPLMLAAVLTRFMATSALVSRIKSNAGKRKFAVGESYFWITASFVSKAFNLSCVDV